MVQRASGGLSPYTLMGALALALFTGMSFFLFIKELDQYSRGLLDETEAFEHWLAPDHDLPLSTNGQIDLLSGCVFALESWKTKFRSKEDTSKVVENCATEANRVLGFNPHLSEAHYLIAYTSYLRESEDQAVHSLAAAQQTAPTDQWLAVRRVNLAQAMFPGEPEIAEYNLQNDLGLLIASNRGLDTATRLYIKYPQLREMIVASTENLSDSARLRFLNKLQSSVARR